MTFEVIDPRQVLQREAPRESCGFYIKDLGFIQVDNISKNDKYFEMDMDQMLEAMKQFEDRIQGVWHTHPGGPPEPSKTDREFHDPSYGYLVIVNEDGIHLWE